MHNPAILSKVQIRNFKLFRHPESFDLSNGTYFIGTNNSGKSTVLNAIRYFFDDTLYEGRDFLNRVEAARKQAGSEIAMTFNLAAVRKTRLREALVKEYGANLQLTKKVKLTETGTLEFSYIIQGHEGSESQWADLSGDLRELVQSIKVNYLHPQRGAELLEDAQLKLRRRLLDNWGRTKAVTQSIRNLETQWESFRSTATRYLSESLQANIQRVWPEGEVQISLPRDVKQLLAISDISFSGYKGAPATDLLNQGSGAQSLILYFAHYMLDIDKTSARAAEHHPIWLLEEPESFMHPDLVAKLANEINSSSWVQNISLIVSTHSAILLSRSRIFGSKAIWHCLTVRGKNRSNPASAWTDEDIEDIGRLMGDSNFRYYFEASRGSTTIYSEDERQETIDSFIRSGINVSKSVRGVTKFKQMVTALVALDSGMLESNASKFVFIIDNDQGFAQVEHLLEDKPTQTASSFQLFRVRELPGAFVILLPRDCSVEDLYEELDAYLDAIANQLLNSDMSLKASTPVDLSDLVTKFRRKRPNTRGEALKVIKSHDEFKTRFWREVDRRAWRFSKESREAIATLLAIVDGTKNVKEKQDDRSKGA